MFSGRIGEKEAEKREVDHVGILYWFGIEQVLFICITSINCRIIKLN